MVFNGQRRADDSNIDKVTNFVESVCLSEQRRQDKEMAGDNEESSHRMNDNDNESLSALEGYKEAKRKAERAIIEAEKYKALLVEPPGGNNRLNPSPNFANKNDAVAVGTGMSDDDFFHLTCHVDAALIAKIEKGEFVDLDKLLPKDKRKRSEGSLLGWVHSEGGTFLAPVNDRLNRINGFRKWEQAFRVYATIYCGANPSRAREIWQYVSVISTAASSFVWENVYEYDVTFRHLMAFNPSRSWVVTYNQIWNLCMRESLPTRTAFGSRMGRGYNNNNSNFRSGLTGPGSTGGGGTGHAAAGKKRMKLDYCWNFNKGIPCKFGKKCRFIERCSYCDAGNHGVYQCSKLEKKSSGDKSGPSMSSPAAAASK